MSNYILNIANNVVSNENTRLIIAPIAMVGALSIGTRVTAGILAQGVKGASLVADYADKKDLCQNLKRVQAGCISFAKRSIKAELQAASVLTTAVLFCLGLKVLRTQPDPTVSEKIINVVGPIFHNVIEDITAHPIKTYLETCFAVYFLTVSFSFAEAVGRDLRLRCLPE